MSSRNNFRTTNTNDYNRRPPRKRDVLIKFIPLLNDPDTYPNDAEIWILLSRLHLTRFSYLYTVVVLLQKVEIRIAMLL